MNNHPQRNPAAGSNASSSQSGPPNGSQQYPLVPRGGQRLPGPGVPNPVHGAARHQTQIPANRQHGLVPGMRQPQGVSGSYPGSGQPQTQQQRPSYGLAQPQQQQQQRRNVFSQHGAPMQARPSSHHSLQGRSVQPSPQQQGWGVPNPLASGGGGNQQSMSMQRSMFNMPQGGSQQQRPLAPPPSGNAPGAGIVQNTHSSQPSSHHSMMYRVRNPAPAAPVQQQPQQRPQQQAPPPSARTPAYQVNPSASTTSSAPSSSSSGGKPRVVLSPEARKALATAIWSAIRSPDGTVAPDALAQAVATGLPKHAVLNAARVAREREALKKKGLLQSSRHQAKPVPTTTQPRAPPVTMVARAPVVARTPVTAPPSSHPQQSLKVQAQAKARLEERTHWKRLQSGVFYVQKGRFLSVPHSIAAAVRSQDVRPALGTPPTARKRSRAECLAQAARLQQELLQAKQQRVAAPPALLDPEKFKRIKIEPKRVAKAIDRAMRKSRAATAEALIKQHKELSKAISIHQTEFFKYHRQRRLEAYRLAKSVRDSLDKEDKKKEKEADQAERARLAALRSNDMDAYSKLLEDTKNERLKFLLSKTDDCIAQISTMLQQRSDEDQNADEFASASAAKSGSYYASAHLKMEDVRQPGILVGGELKEYQVAGLQWMVSLYNNKLNGILADEMGLGKTIQAISLVAYLMEFKNNLGPYLIIVPLSTLSNWQNEFQKWLPSAKLVTYKGTPQQRKETYKEQVQTGHFNVLLTTYEYIIRDKASLRKIQWQYAIVDEGHRMKNAQSKFAVTLGTMYTTKNRILLTGTPLQNSLPELWALLNFLLPTIFNSVESFDQWFNRPFANYGSSTSADDSTDQMLSNEERMLIIHRLHELLRPFMLRRVKSEVLDQLPEKVEKILRCDLSSWQKELYKQISKKVIADKSIMGTFVEQPSRGLNNVVMQLRKVCNHPFLFSPEGYRVDDNLIRSSGKLHLLDQMLPKLKAAGHRVLIFTQMTAVMTILEDYFAYRGYSNLRLDGSTPAEEREKRMYQFNAPDSPHFIFCLSTRAGGLGLNLATANIVIIFDSDWNPQADLQAQDRAHRIGQRSDVSVFRLITNSPVEEKILSRATEKLNMSELVVEAGKFNKSSVENDNSLERKKMMEVLLTDFDTTATSGTQVKSSETAESQSEDVDNDEADVESAASDTENLNELLSNNETDFELYTEIDEATAHSHLHLFTNPDDVPDWIKHPVNPSGKKSGGQQEVLGDTRKRKAVAYDDGLTEKQFLRLMEKQADAEESFARGKKRQKTSKSPASKALAKEAAMEGEDTPGSLTEWTFRKLISCTKVVIALKEPSTKRRLSEIFLEKPDANTYPDYYDMIESPIAINDILRKCRGHLYGEIQEFQDDWKLLFANCKKFNGPDSWVTQDANALEKELERVMKKNGFSETPQPQKPKRKPLRIKLSLKKSKSDKDAADSEDKDSSSTTQPTPKKSGSAKKSKNGKKA